MTRQLQQQKAGRFSRKTKRKEKQVEDGFYKEDKYAGWRLMYAPNSVYHRDYTLTRDGHNRGLYEYPIGGWTWYNSEKEAYAAHNVPHPPVEPVEPVEPMD